MAPHKAFFVFSFFMLFTVGTTTVIAAKSTQDAFLQNLTQANKVPVRRNTNLVSDKALFEYRIIDASRQVVGQLGDLIVNDVGQIESIGSKITKGSRVRGLVYRPYSPTQFRKDISAFEIDFDMTTSPKDKSSADTEVLSADTQDGEQATKNITDEESFAPIPMTSFSVKDMVGRKLTSPGGRFVGQIESVVFDNKLTRIEGLLLSDVPGTRGNKEILLPFTAGNISFSDRFGGGRLEINLDTDRAQDLKDFAKSLR